MKRLFSWFLQRWVLSLLVVLVLAVLIWIDGPMLSFNGTQFLASDTVRWSLILLLLAIWAGFWIWRLVAERLAKSRLLQVVAGDPAAVAADTAPTAEIAAERQTLAQNMEAAIAMLRKSGAGGGGQFLYRMPWYVFVGAPGAGKTTALQHSGLQFAQDTDSGALAMVGVGGTRNCDWWFSDEAVLLDTAGRYTTQDSFAEVDSAGWNNFLDLLARHRKRRPINGVIVAVSMVDLLQKNEAERTSLALQIRARIKELHVRLGIRFPVYVMLTKCDLLAGFADFFEHMNREQRTQVWGVTLPLLEAARIDQLLAGFPAEFDALERQLQARLLERLQQESDVHRRALLYGFPQQFAAIGPALQHMLQTMFQSTRFEEPVLLRGVYFTSGTQEGNPIDRVIGTLAQAFGLDRTTLPANVSSGRSFFVTKMLREVVFKEAELAGANLRLERERQWMQRGLLILLGLFVSILLTLRVTSFLGNRALLQEIDLQTTVVEQLARETPREASLPALLPLLNAVRDLPLGYTQRDEPVSLLLRIGMYQGTRLTPAQVGLYQRLLREALLPRLRVRLEDVLGREDANSLDLLHEGLRMYLMLGDPQHFDADALQAWFDLDLANNLPGLEDAARADLAGHIAALLALEGQRGEALISPDAELLKAVRLVLARQALPQRIYQRMKREAPSFSLPEFSVTGAAGPGAALVLARFSGEPLSRGVPGFFTLAGYRKFMEVLDLAIADVALDGWVVGQQEALASLSEIDQVKQAVRQLYFADYIVHWDAFLGDIGIIAFTSFDEGQRLAATLAAADSPLRKLLQAAVKETSPGMQKSGLPAADSLVKAARGKLDAYKKKLESALGAKVEVPTGNPGQTVNPVDAHFGTLARLATGSTDAPAPLEQTLGLLKAAALYFDSAEEARRNGLPMPPAEALTRLQREAVGKPAPLLEVLLGVEQMGAGLRYDSDRARINAAWLAGPARFCRTAIAGRYPLSRKADGEVLADDFGKFFAPGGMIDDFFQKQLAPFVDVTQTRWRWREGAGVQLGIAPEVLAQFQAAASIRDMYFVAGARQASLRFQLKPVALDPALLGVTLELDGQTLATAANQPATSVLFQIPSGKRSDLVRFETNPAAEKPLPRTEGPWAWLRMLDLAKVEATPQSERFRLLFDLEGRKLELEMTASSVVNPFRREVLEQFQCPDQL